MDLRHIIDKKIKWPLFDSSPVPIAVVDNSGNFICVNDMWCALTGYSKAELHNMSFQQITCIPDLHGDLAQMGDVIKIGGNSQSQMIKRYIRKDGTTIQFNLVYNTIVDDDNNVIGFISWALPIQKKQHIITDEKLKIILIIVGIITIINLLINANII